MIDTRGAAFTVVNFCTRRDRRPQLRLLTVALVAALATWGNIIAPPARAGVPVKREILALYDGTREGSISSTRIHRFAEMPLNHLGFILRYHDVRTPLPSLTDVERYRGVLSWFAGPIPDGHTYLTWMGQISRIGPRIVVLGDVGVSVTSHNLRLVNYFLGALGLRHAGDYIMPTRGTRVIRKDEELIEFECKLDPVLPGYPIIDIVGANVRVGLALEASPHEGRLSTSLVTVNDKGAYAAFNYEFCHQRAPTHRGRWFVNPFSFFEIAFGAHRFPIPDTTTVSGRRLYFGQLHSEGWTNQTEIERYKRTNAIASEVILTELLEPYFDLPMTIDLRDLDVERPARKAEKARAIAQRILALPHVDRPGRNSIGTIVSRFDSWFPSISSLSALATPGPAKVFYTATGDETAYAEAGQRALIAFHSLSETLAKTEAPRRLKGFNLNYHVFAGQHAALLQAVREHLVAARTAKLAPVSANAYAEIAAGFFTAAIEQIGSSSWRISNRGMLQTIRFDTAEELEVDFQASVGVIGQTRHGRALYAALDESVESVSLVLRSLHSLGSHHRGMALVDSRWRIRNFIRNECLLSFDAMGYGQGEFTWSGAVPTRYEIAASRQGLELWRDFAIAGVDGRLSFVVPVAAIDPVTIEVSCSGARTP